MTAHARTRAGAFYAGILSLLFAALAHSADKLPEVTPDGLHLVKQDEFSALYVRPGVSFAPYTKVAILECFVAFKSGWVQSMNADDPLSLTPQTVKDIKTRLAAEFMKVFKQQLSADGFAVVDDAAKDVLVLRPAIINLEIQAPDPMGQADEVTISQSTGQMTLYLELYDSVSSELLARVIDASAAGGSGGSFGWQTSVGNLMAADQILKQWSDRLEKYLRSAQATH